MADLLGTKKSNIFRLESVSSEVSPRLSTVEDYAASKNACKLHLSYQY